MTTSEQSMVVEEPGSEGQGDDELLARVVDRIVAAAQPDRIILFGSCGRGEATRSSDVDLLVVKRGAHRRRTAQAIYRNLVGVGQAVDVVVVTPEDLERYGNASSMVIAPALREGKTIYRA